MRDAKILITGPTGMVALPVTQALAADNDVWAAARFRDEGAKRRLEGAGARCVEVDLVAGDFSALPRDFDYVVNFAVAKTGDWKADLAVNAESPGLLMAHCRDARAFLHCSSTAVYDPPDRDPRDEDAALGDNHKPMFATYSISKIAGEAVVRTMARHLGLATTIARLNVPYGDNTGWPYFHLEMMLAGMEIPVPPGGPAMYNPIHTHDITAQVPKLLAVASVPAVTVNWGGDQAVSLQEWCTFLGELVGRQPVFAESASALGPVPVDLARLHELVGGTTVDWKDGMRRLAKAAHPELVVH
ncbi:MAG TPA: NAD(P)-dependent oxidoreductase [Acidimicrobiales bacterium]|nr:NAD(P)-dependent oxidoreductase [Acidimicrobiales bacterium]